MHYKVSTQLGTRGQHIKWSKSVVLSTETSENKKKYFDPFPGKTQIESLISSENL